MHMYMLKDVMFKECNEFREMLNEIFKHYFGIEIKEYEIISEGLPVVNNKDREKRTDILLKMKNENYYINIESNIKNGMSKEDIILNTNILPEELEKIIENN